MENLYFDAFEKYGTALSALWPNQLEEVREALDIYTETGEIMRIEDSFSRLAFNMILCDLRSKKKGKRGR